MEERRQQCTDVTISLLLVVSMYTYEIMSNFSRIRMYTIVLGVIRSGVPNWTVKTLESQVSQPFRLLALICKQRS